MYFYFVLLIYSKFFCLCDVCATLPEALHKSQINWTINVHTVTKTFQKWFSFLKLLRHRSVPKRPKTVDDAHRRFWIERWWAILDGHGRFRMEQWRKSFKNERITVKNTTNDKNDLDPNDYFSNVKITKLELFFISLRAHFEFAKSIKLFAISFWEKKFVLGIEKKKTHLRVIYNF